MANTDRPHGWVPAGKVDGSPWNGLVRNMVASAADMFIGDALIATSGAAAPATADNGTFLGVMVGFGYNETDVGVMGADGGVAFNYDDLMSRYFDTSAMTAAEFNIFYVPARGSVFKGQADGDETAALLVGTSYDLVYTTGNTTTGRSKQEINGDQTAADNTEGVMIVKKDLRPDNDPANDFADYVVSFNTVV